MLSRCEMIGENELIISGDPMIMLLADQDRLEQVVVNFVNNAVKYAPDVKNIYLKVVQIDSLAKVSVTDAGAGIEQDKLPMLFDRYFRTDYSGKQYSGLGLGLYICSEIIKHHGGNIGVDSKLGKGSSFWFTLPME